MSFTVRQVVKATDEEIQATAELVGTTFLHASNPFVKVALLNDRKLGIACIRGGIISGNMGGEIYVAENDRRDIIGVAVGFPPGQHPYGSAEQQEAGLAPFMAMCPEDLQRWWKDYFEPETAAFTDAQFGAEAKQKGWCLYLLAVAPEYHGKGIGKALYHKFSEKATAEGAMLYLETTTEKNVHMYEHFGMRIRGEKKSFEGSGGTFQLTCMST